MTKERFLYYIGIDDLYIKDELSWLAKNDGIDTSYEIARMLYDKFCEYDTIYPNEFDYDNFIAFFTQFENEILAFVYGDIDDFHILKGDN